MAGFPKKKHYYRLAHIMHKDQNLAIFNNFNELAMVQLLRLQAEIVELRGALEHQIRQNSKSEDKDEQRYSQSFRLLHASKPAGGEEVQLHDLIQSKLTSYYDLMIKGKVNSTGAAQRWVNTQAVSQIERLREPDKQQLKELQEWLGDSRGGNNFPLELELTTWLDKDRSQYVCPGPARAEPDFFTTLLSRHVVRLYHHLWGRRGPSKHIIDDESGLRCYDDSIINRVAAVATVIVASTLPVLTIYILNVLPTKELRIGVTAILTAVFAGMLAAFSSAKRAEIFAATATFAAVEVVYIGSTLEKS
ncbi:hypothetical protein PG984_016588 [Apiospora sp. TS-2023a]